MNPLVYLVALFTPAIITAAVIPLWRRHCEKLGLVDAPGERKLQVQPVPLAGGFAIATGLLVSILLGSALTCFDWGDNEIAAKLQYGLSHRAHPLATILAGGIGMLLLGAIDDRHELRPGVKFAGQLTIAAAVAATGVRITLFVESDIFSYAITLLWIVTITNAFNFMDNMNGLCAGIGLIAASLFAALAALQGQYLVASFGLVTAGALGGFLPWNFPRARVYLGDAGSHLVGYLVAVLGVLAHFYSPQNPRGWAVLSPLLILSVPLLDLVSVVIIRWRLGKPFYIGDRNHLSHRLVRRGLTPIGAVVRLWLLGLVVGSLSFLFFL